LEKLVIEKGGFLMTRLNTEYIAKMRNSHLRRAKLSTDIAVFKEEMQIRKALQKELDELD